MKKRSSVLSKSYKNMAFINSPQARTLRILSEYLEPQQRFSDQSVRDTVVFFGSARILPEDKARRRLKDVGRKFDRAKRKTAPLKRELELAENGLVMARYYEEAQELARLITAWSEGLPDGRRFVVCSGGGPGIMEAANRGAALAGGPSVGLNISLPFEQHANPYITEALNFEFHYFFMRKLWFVYLAKAMAVFPGGFGTFDELMELLTLLQTHKVSKPMPMVIYGTDYWREVLNFDALARWGMVSDRDLDLFRFVDTPQEAFDYLQTELTRLYL